ncbi:universal stress protein [Bacteroidales bacterium OttesenSCG-928-I14]|nr:universal stress protein [Bacteroidales bacterium OttesenSCG-928-I14]
MKKKDGVLIPVDFSEYSKQACEIGFWYASKVGAEVVLFHASYFNPVFTPKIFKIDNVDEDASVLEIQEQGSFYQDTEKKLEDFAEFVKTKIKKREWPNVRFETVISNGLPEEEILNYAKKNPLRMIIMGTRGKDRKDLDLIGSVTAEVIDRSKVPVLAIPENTPFNDITDVKRIAFGTGFNERDLVAFDALLKMFQNFDVEYYLFHLSHKKDTWDEIKLAGIKEYYEKRYPNYTINYNIIDADEFLRGMEDFIKLNNIDVISLATYKRNLFTRLFNPSIAHKMLFHTDTPVLAFYS